MPLINYSLNYKPKMPFRVFICLIKPNLEFIKSVTHLVFNRQINIQNGIFNFIKLFGKNNSGTHAAVDYIKHSTAEKRNMIFEKKFSKKLYFRL